MIRYFVNREVADKLDINLARWKRWSRAFLPPDPLGGLQSGYARQYAFDDLMRVYLGGHLVSHLKLSFVEAARVLDDLTPWLKKNGFLSANAPPVPTDPRSAPTVADHRIYFSPKPDRNGNHGPLFRYLIQSPIERHAEAASPQRRVRETFTEHLINWPAADGASVLRDPGVRMLNPGALWQHVVTRLQQRRQ